jgi:hypothetical protein
MLEHNVRAKITRKGSMRGLPLTTLTTSRVGYMPEGIRSDQFSDASILRSVDRLAHQDWKSYWRLWSEGRHRFPIGNRPTLVLNCAATLRDGQSGD